MVHGGMSIVKYLIFVFNFIFVVSGIALIAVGAIVVSKGSAFTEFVGSKFVTLPNLVIAVGVIVLIIAFLGCCGAVKENYCMVMSFSVLLFVIFIVELGGGIAAYVYRNEFKDFLKTNMQSSIDQHKTDVGVLWAETQSKLKCCGVNGPGDWGMGPNAPDSCCGVIDPDNLTKTCPILSAYQQGCLPALESFVESKVLMVGGAAVGVGVIELIGVIFACCLANAIKKEYEGV